MSSGAGKITILGLGPGDPGLLTREAWEWLQAIDELFVRTVHHPTLEGLPSSLRVISFDSYYEEGQRFEEVYARTVEEVLRLGRRPEGVSYAVPGHPLVAEATTPEILRRARQEGIPVRVIEGISFLEPAFNALGIDPFPQLTVADALEIGNRYFPPFVPDQPVLIGQIYSKETASQLKLTLMELYPDDHPVKLVHAAGTPEERVESLPLYQIDRSPHLGLLTALYVPPLGEHTSFESLEEIVAHLRAPEGCPWDREQTHASLSPNLLEETYEVLDAIDGGNASAMTEELGDLLLQIVLHAQIASEEGEFRMTDVLNGIEDKLVRRHPHVFGSVKVTGAGEALRNWERIKEAEREDAGEDRRRGMLSGVPKALPALAQAQAVQDRAARVGFDWEDISGVEEKVREETGEFRAAEGDERRAEEFGDLLFSLVNLARWQHIDAEDALRGAVRRFRQRFEHIEQGARDSGRALDELSLQEMDALWDEAKHHGDGAQGNGSSG